MYIHILVNRNMFANDLEVQQFQIFNRLLRLLYYRLLKLFKQVVYNYSNTYNLHNQKKKFRPFVGWAFLGKLAVSHMQISVSKNQAFAWVLPVKVMTCRAHQPRELNSHEKTQRHDTTKSVTLYYNTNLWLNCEWTA